MIFAKELTYLTMFLCIQEINMHMISKILVAHLVDFLQIMYYKFTLKRFLNNIFLYFIYEYYILILIKSIILIELSILFFFF